MKRGKHKGATAGSPVPKETPVSEEVTSPSITTSGSDMDWDGPTRAGGEDEIADLVAQSARLEAEIAAEAVWVEGDAAVATAGESEGAAPGEGAGASGAGPPGPQPP